MPAEKLSHAFVFSLSHFVLLLFLLAKFNISTYVYLYTLKTELINLLSKKNVLGMCCACAKGLQSEQK